jgi:hypothetical protein
MLQIRDHGVADYTALLDMNATDVGVLTDDGRACLDELGAYLTTTESWQRFAVWLLHKHFEPADREIFVERAAPEHQTTETTLVERSVLSPHGISAMGIRFDPEVDADVRTVSAEYGYRPGDLAIKGRYRLTDRT